MVTTFPLADESTGPAWADHGRRPELWLVGPEGVPGRSRSGSVPAREGGDRPACRTGAADAPVRRRASVEVRRRRTLLVLMGALLFVLALPLGGVGGHSHATGSAPAGNGTPAAYVVRQGDTLWSIAGRADPSGDPRPLVARLAAQVGSDTVIPGERIILP